MDDITEIESRLRRALERIETRLDDEDGAGEAARLRDELTGEREAMAQLTERYELVRKRHAARLKVLEAEIEEAEARADAAEAQSARLLAANQRLRDAAEKVRVAAQEGSVVSGDVDALLREEVSALNEAREADRASLDALLEELAPFTSTTIEDDVPVDDAGDGSEHASDPQPLEDDGAEDGERSVEEALDAAMDDAEDDEDASDEETTP